MTGIEVDVGEGASGLGVNILGVGLDYVHKKISYTSDGISLERGTTIGIFTVTDGFVFMPDVIVIQPSPIIDQELAGGNTTAWSEMWTFIESNVPENYVYIGSVYPDENFDFRSWVTTYTYHGNITPEDVQWFPIP